ncbi:hypothetical protein GCM10027169_27190 [Gordonia jinhuaensis]
MTCDSGNARRSAQVNGSMRTRDRCQGRDGSWLSGLPPWSTSTAERTGVSRRLFTPANVPARRLHPPGLLARQSVLTTGLASEAATVALIR